MPEKKQKTPSFAYTRRNEKGEIELVTRPGNPQSGKVHKNPRTREEALAILAAYGEKVEGSEQYAPIGEREMADLVMGWLKEQGFSVTITRDGFLHATRQDTAWLIEVLGTPSSHRLAVRDIEEALGRLQLSEHKADKRVLALHPGYDGVVREVHPRLQALDIGVLRVAEQTVEMLSAA